MGATKFQLIRKNKFGFDNLVLDDYDYSSKFKELDDVSPTSRLEGHEKEMKEITEIQILAPQKLLTRIIVLLAQIEDGAGIYKN